ncbi:hypothetical protein [Rhodoblastus sp.]|uniref:hypothetical protein n=1 Tax=Rhodoblastus sp. TaxID=1962975 RepID=UPI003F96D6A5
MAGDEFKEFAGLDVAIDQLRREIAGRPGGRMFALTGREFELRLAPSIGDIGGDFAERRLKLLDCDGSGHGERAQKVELRVDLRADHCRKPRFPNF